MGYVSTIPTPVGPFTVIAGDDDSVLASGWTDDPERLLGSIAPPLVPAASPRRAGASPARDAVVAYHDGDVVAPDAVAVRYAAGPFLSAAWAALRKVAPGELITYRELARRAGSADAVRAAGSACARNPVALFVPCHRVARSDGTLGGFGYGLPVKRWLLDHEGARRDPGTLPV